jgi:hypothetical protein
MDDQADQPFGGGADPVDPPHGGQQPGPQPWGTLQPGPQPGSPPPQGTPPAGPQPGSPQPWGTPEPGPQPGGGPPQYGGQQAGAGQPPVIAGTSAGRPRVRPGRIWYLAAVVLFLAGVAWLVYGFVSLSSRVDAFSRVPLPGGGTVTLDHSGGYVVYYEGAGATTGQIPGFIVRIAPASPPAGVGSLRPYGASVTYSIGAHQGRAVLTFEVVHPGRFLVEPSGATAVTGGSDLAFGSSIAGGIVGTVVLSIGLIFLGIAAAIVLFIIRLTRTRRARAQAGAY